MLQDNLTIVHLLARVYIDDQRWEDAIEELERVLDGEPENYDAYYDLGHVCFELGDYEAAISNFENVIEYREDSELLFYSLAQFVPALGYFFKISLNIFTYLFYFAMSLSIAAIAKWQDKNISNYLKSIAVNDKFSLAYKKVAILFMARNDFEDAIEYFEDYTKFDIPQEEKENVAKLIERIKAKQG